MILNIFYTMKTEHCLAGMMHGGDLTVPNKRISLTEKEWLNVSLVVIVLVISIILLFVFNGFLFFVGLLSALNHLDQARKNSLQSTVDYSRYVKR